MCLENAELKVQLWSRAEEKLFMEQHIEHTLYVSAGVRYHSQRGFHSQSLHRFRVMELVFIEDPSSISIFRIRNCLIPAWFGMERDHFSPHELPGP